MFALRRAVLACLVLALAASSVPAADTSGLPLPRFVSLRSDEVNLRTGPGTRYPVEWVYNRRDLPVEIIAEFDMWRKIRDWQGAEGWVHQSMLSSRRMIVIIGAERALRDQPDENGALLAKLTPNVVGRLLQCPRGRKYCRVDVQSTQGWLRREDFWGVYQSEYIE